ncbi:MAG TPA: 2-C-methyl-D-erythritol 4-phosphate cytidylyltransferase [Steroidobacteraceae bacterium]|nr:2-C-methyl-D-erythritol 4-phosphate cytidylyltransferase [Steroidobacteraceae bacterium]
MRYWLVMPAAGSGSRSGLAQPKQYAEIAGRSVIEWSLQPFLDDARCQGLMVALAPDDTRFANLGLPSAGTRLRHCAGGARRCDSVLAALQALPAADGDWVLVHDAARPCVTTADIDSLLAALQGHATGGLLAVPLSDTLKRADGANEALDTLPREGLWRALTPQMFRFGPLRDALEKALRTGVQPTDEAQAMELAGLRPALVAGSPQNIKITTEQDLALAARILQARRSES